jgi:hypothetical protein
MNPSSTPVAAPAEALRRFGAQVRLGFMLMLTLCAVLLVHTS